MLDTLVRALEVEYRFILYYPKLEGLMPDADSAARVRILGEASRRHAEVVSQAITSLGGRATTPTLDPLPEPLDLRALFGTHLEHGKLALWLHNRAAGLVREELARRFRELCRDEQWHIGQSVYLVATSLWLGACAIGAFLDDDINRLPGVDGKEKAVLYLLAVGTPTF